MFFKKGVYPYEYMDDWEKFNETTLLEKKEIYSNLNLEDITDADYANAKWGYKGFKTKRLGDLDDALLLADIFQSFRDMCLGKYELDPVKSISAPSLAWQAALKRHK